MKKITNTISFFVIIFTANNIFSQKNIIKANPVTPFFKVYNIGYERETSEKQSISISLYDYNFSNYNGYLVNSEYRFYLSKKEGLRGFFMVQVFSILNLNLILVAISIKNIFML